MLLYLHRVQIGLTFNPTLSALLQPLRHHHLPSTAGSSEHGPPPGAHIWFNWKCPPYISTMRLLGNPFLHTWVWPIAGSGMPCLSQSPEAHVHSAHGNELVWYSECWIKKSILFFFSNNIQTTFVTNYGCNVANGYVALKGNSVKIRNSSRCCNPIKWFDQI